MVWHNACRCFGTSTQASTSSCSTSPAADLPELRTAIWDAVEVGGHKKGVICVNPRMKPKPDDPRADRDLLVAARSGDGQAFGVFYRRHHDLVLAFLARGCPPEIAADLLAETFAAALHSLLDRQRELPREPFAWLLTISRNKLTDSLRRGRVDAAARARLRLEPLELSDGDLHEIEQLAAETDLMGRLALALPPDQLQALRARILEEQDYAEIARSLSCSQAVVRKRVSRAIHTLRTTEVLP